MEDKAGKIKELVKELNRARRTYEQEDREIMSNFEYDRLYDQLKALEEETGIVLASSPTVNVGYDVVSQLPKEEHPSPMLSLDKTKDPQDLKAWLGDKEGLLSWKLDGLTVVLTYDDGNLSKAVTRGNGTIGEVITANARTFENLPLSIPFKGHLVLRGEAVIRYSDFERINGTIPEAEAKYKNPRNLCSGSVRQLDSSIQERKLKFKPELDVRGQRLQDALDIVTHYIDDAIMLGMSSVRIIHGKGTGVLRDEIQKYLRTVPGVASVKDEAIQFGGTGVTIVTFD